jgi:chloramphenicol 3-O phosphotransferase
MAVIVILNGNSSAGKSSIARALQCITAQPFLHVPMDTFLDMMPDVLFEGPEGMVFRTLEDSQGPITEIVIGPAAQRTLQGMRRAVAALAAQGNNLILDEVMVGGDAADFAAAFAGLKVHWVAVHAPLDILEERERQRGDRHPGLARGLARHVHKCVRYDLELDTAAADAAECAAMIKQAFGL